MVNLLNELVGEISDREAHALMGLLDVMFHFVYDCEERVIESPSSESHAVPRGSA
jgi:hypothetical protein